MKRPAALIILAVWATCASAQPAVDPRYDADFSVRIWDNSSAPHSNCETEAETSNERLHLSHISETVAYVYKADPEKATGQAVVILPGGGYYKVSMWHEGFCAAKWFRDNGLTAVVLKYRLPNLGHMEVPLEDAVEALRYLRKHAGELGIDPSKVGISGCSAGGHLAAYASTFTSKEDRPAFAILFYPVITGTTWATSQNTFRYLLGDARTPVMQEKYSLENAVDENTPPTLILLSDDDRTVPPISSIRYYKALKSHGVKASMHIYGDGGHGWSGHDDFRHDAEVKRTIKDWLTTLE